MITTYCPVNGEVQRFTGFVTAEHFEQAAWIDLLSPTSDEEQHIESLLGVDLPTREEMRAIEDSHRFYEEHGAVYLTVTVMVNSETEYPRAEDLTFALTRQRLVTVRYAEPKAVRLYSGRIERSPASGCSGEEAFLGLFESLIERLADAIERVGAELDDLAHQILSPAERSQPRLNHAAMLRQLERDQTLIAKARSSLSSLNRALNFLHRPSLDFELSKNFRARAATLQHDLQSLVDHTAFVANNISFELAAILGMINIEQNGIIKIFSVAAVVFMPPTLVASIYGMNFKLMPELDWRFGYPMALGLLLASAVATYGFFKRRGWL